MTVFCEGHSEMQWEATLTRSLKHAEVRMVLLGGDEGGSSQVKNRRFVHDLERATRGGRERVFVVLDLVGNPFRRDASTPEELRTRVLELVAGPLRQSVRPHVFVHELEALYFADPKLLKDSINLDIPEDWASAPEGVNSINTPFKQLAALCQLTSNVPTPPKVALAKKILPRLDPEKVALKCPNFKLFWEDLLQEAKA